MTIALETGIGRKPHIHKTRSQCLNVLGVSSTLFEYTASLAVIQHENIQIVHIAENQEDSGRQPDLENCLIYLGYFSNILCFVGCLCYCETVKSFQQCSKENRHARRDDDLSAEKMTMPAVLELFVSGVAIAATVISAISSDYPEDRI